MLKWSELDRTTRRWLREGKEILWVHLDIGSCLSYRIFLAQEPIYRSGKILKESQRYHWDKSGNNVKISRTLIIKSGDGRVKLSEERLRNGWIDFLDLDNL